MVRGEPGIGKSALLEQAVATAGNFQVVQSGGVEAETDLPFAVLQQVCSPLLSVRERLPAPQQDALAVTFGLRGGAPPEPLTLGLAVLGLLSRAAARRALICVIDDAQWLDPGSAEVLGFVARRIGADPLGIAFATRRTDDGFRGLPEVVVSGLGPGDARALLGSAPHAPLDEAVAERIAVEARGNPLALLELSRTVPAVAFAGGIGPPGTATLPGRIEDSFRDRVLALPPATRLLLLLVAAEPLGDAALLWRAAARLRITSSAALAAEDEGLPSIGTRWCSATRWCARLSTARRRPCSGRPCTGHRPPSGSMRKPRRSWRDRLIGPRPAAGGSRPASPWPSAPWRSPSTRPTACCTRTRCSSTSPRW